MEDSCLFGSVATSADGRALIDGDLGSKGASEVVVIGVVPAFEDREIGARIGAQVRPVEDALDHGLGTL